MRKAFRSISIAAFVLVLCGCEEGPMRREPAEVVKDDVQTVLAAPARAVLDRGNAAYAEGDFARAMDHYAAAVDLAPDHPAPRFGVYMAALALGDGASAESALVEFRRRIPVDEMGP